MYRNTAAWTETGVTWDTMPGFAGSPVTASSALGWVSWAVTDLVTEMYSGSNHGFLVKDCDESNNKIQTYSTREGSASIQPQLVLTWG